MIYEITDITLKSKAETALGTTRMEKRESEITEFYVTVKKRSGENKLWRKSQRLFAINYNLRFK